MKLILSSIALAFVVISCSKSSDDTISTQNDILGGYSGSFQRTGYDSTIVTLDLNMGTYDGTSRTPGYPAICGGHYTRNSSTIVFDDTCSWPNTIDPTLILDGTYNFEKLEEGHIRFWRTNGAVTDEYDLRKIVR